MRRKQLLGVLLSLLVMCAITMAADLHLTGVNVANKGNTTTVTIQASGAFTHTEYRPSDNLLLVDLAGVSAGSLEGQSRAVEAPGITSYRVESFRGVGGAEVARVELSLVSTPMVNFSEENGTLHVQVTSVQSAAAPSAAAPAAPASQAVAPATAASAASDETLSSHQASKLEQPVMVRSVGVTRGKDGIEVNIRGSGPLKPSVMKLSDPERLVVDLSNARTLQSRQISVNADQVKGVRMALYQINPPVTRVVVDLESARDYELVPTGSDLRVKLHAPALVASAGAPPVAPSSPQITLPQAAPAVSDNASAAATKPADPTPQAASDAVPASQPASATSSAANAAPASAKQAEAAPAVSSVPESAKEAAPEKTAPASAVPVSVPQPAAVPAASSKAQDYVVVQPSFKPKSEEAESKPGDEPVARAADAASKFSNGKTEIALATMPALMSGNASMPPAAMAAALPQPPQAPAAQPQATQPAQGGSQYGRPKYTGEPISVNLKDVDLKDFFRLVHEISGLNVVLDPNVRGTLTLVLDDVPWDQALDIVLKNNGLERELDGNVLRIATVDTLRREADARRAQVEAQALAAPKITVTRFLSYAHSKDVVPTIKKFLTQRGEIISDDRTNALFIQDIPAVFPEIDRLLAQLDRKTPEVEIEARVVAATRNFARDIGTQLGFAWGNGKSTAVGGAGSVGPSPIVVTPPAGAPPSPFITSTSGSSSGSSSSTSTGIQIPLFSNLPALGPTSGLSLINMGSNYRLDVILTAAESRGLLKILSRPRVVTQNNIQAVVRQGVRVPVVTQAQLGGPPTTTYVDAFLRLTVTPQITAENTIFLNVDVENTTPDFGHSVNGNPTLLTQQALTQVLVTDGGTVVIGGVIATKNSVSIEQVPLLGSIPGLGNLFKHRAVSTETQELFFFITPKIIQT